MKQVGTSACSQYMIEDITHNSFSGQCRWLTIEGMLPYDGVNTIFIYFGFDVSFISKITTVLLAKSRS